MERDLLLLIHAHARPALDALFVFSHALGTPAFCLGLVLLAAGWHALHHERPYALLWLGLGLSTLVVQEALKLAVGRARPELWPRLVTQPGFSFPSGHAIAAATFFPLLAATASRAWPDARRWAWAAALLLGFYVGFGRMYLGVHWPTDVVAGWAIGTVQTAVGLSLVTDKRASEDLSSTRGSRDQGSTT
jgi:membrane-associated phospholipid phosphatase